VDSLVAGQGFNHSRAPKQVRQRGAARVTVMSTSDGSAAMAAARDDAAGRALGAVARFAQAAFEQKHRSLRGLSDPASEQFARLLVECAEAGVPATGSGDLGVGDAAPHLCAIEAVVSGTPKPWDVVAVLFRHAMRLTTWTQPLRLACEDALVSCAAGAVRKGSPPSRTALGVVMAERDMAAAPAASAGTAERCLSRPAQDIVQLALLLEAFRLGAEEDEGGSQVGSPTARTRRSVSAPAGDAIAEEDGDGGEPAAADGSAGGEEGGPDDGMARTVTSPDDVDRELDGPSAPGGFPWGPSGGSPRHRAGSSSSSILTRTPSILTLGSGRSYGTIVSVSGGAGPTPEQLDRAVEESTSGVTAAAGDSRVRHMLRVLGHDGLHRAVCGSAEALAACRAAAAQAAVERQAEGLRAMDEAFALCPAVHALWWRCGGRTRGLATGPPDLERYVPQALVSELLSRLPARHPLPPPLGARSQSMPLDGDEPETGLAGAPKTGAEQPLLATAVSTSMPRAAPAAAAAPLTAEDWEGISEGLATSALVVSGGPPALVWPSLNLWGVFSTQVAVQLGFDAKGLDGDTDDDGAVLRGGALAAVEPVRELAAHAFKLRLLVVGVTDPEGGAVPRGSRARAGRASGPASLGPSMSPVASHSSLGAPGRGRARTLSGQTLGLSFSFVHGSGPGPVGGTRSVTGWGGDEDDADDDGSQARRHDSSVLPLSPRTVSILQGVTSGAGIAGGWRLDGGLESPAGPALGGSAGLGGAVAGAVLPAAGSDQEASERAAAGPGAVPLPAGGAPRAGSAVAATPGGHAAADAVGADLRPKKVRDPTKTVHEVAELRPEFGEARRHFLEIVASEVVRDGAMLMSKVGEVIHGGVSPAEEAVLVEGLRAAKVWKAKVKWLLGHDHFQFHGHSCSFQGQPQRDAAIRERARAVLVDVGGSLMLPDVERQLRSELPAAMLPADLRSVLLCPPSRGGLFVLDEADSQLQLAPPEDDDEAPARSGSGGPPAPEAAVSPSPPAAAAHRDALAGTPPPAVPPGLWSPAAVPVAPPSAPGPAAPLRSSWGAQQPAGAVLASGVMACLLRPGAPESVPVLYLAHAAAADGVTPDLLASVRPSPEAALRRWGAATLVVEGMGAAAAVSLRRSSPGRSPREASEDAGPGARLVRGAGLPPVRGGAAVVLSAAHATGVLPCFASIAAAALAAAAVDVIISLPPSGPRQTDRPGMVAALGDSTDEALRAAAGLLSVSASGDVALEPGALEALPLRITGTVFLLSQLCPDWQAPVGGVHGTADLGRMRSATERLLPRTLLAVLGAAFHDDGPTALAASLAAGLAAAAPALAQPLFIGAVCVGLAMPEPGRSTVQRALAEARAVLRGLTTPPCGVKFAAQATAVVAQRERAQRAATPLAELATELRSQLGQDAMSRALRCAPEDLDRWDAVEARAWQSACAILRPPAWGDRVPVLPHRTALRDLHSPPDDGGGMRQALLAFAPDLEVHRGAVSLGWTARVGGKGEEAPAEGHGFGAGQAAAAASNPFAERTSPSSSALTASASSLASLESYRPGAQRPALPVPARGRREDRGTAPALEPRASWDDDDDDDDDGSGRFDSLRAPAARRERGLTILRALSLREDSAGEGAHAVTWGRVLDLPERHDRELKSLFPRGWPSWLRKHVPKYASSFLNTRGGSLYFGVRDDGTVQTMRMEAKTRDQIVCEVGSILASAVSPPLEGHTYAVDFIAVAPPRTEAEVAAAVEAAGVTHEESRSPEHMSAFHIVRVSFFQPDDFEAVGYSALGAPAGPVMWVRQQARSRRLLTTDDVAGWFRRRLEAVRAATLRLLLTSGRAGVRTAMTPGAPLRADSAPVASVPAGSVVMTREELARLVEDVSAVTVRKTLAAIAVPAPMAQQRAPPPAHGMRYPPQVGHYSPRGMLPPHMGRGGRPHG